MNEIKVAFLSWHYKSPKIFLDTLKKMTPNCSGKWGNIIAVENPAEADYSLIFDGYDGGYPKTRAIYFGQHPYIPNYSPSFRTFEDKDTCVARISLDKYFNAGEWWIKHTYDELMSLESPKKTKDLACIMTYQTHNPMYAQRVKFMQTLVSKYTKFDLYGRPEERFRNDIILPKVFRGSLGFNKPEGILGEHLIGKEIIQNYRYSLEFDVGPTKNYISERFYDALLLWTMPIYFGSNNVHTIIPKEAFHYVNIHDLSQVDKVIEIINSDSREKNMDAIREARNLLLNRYQMFPFAWEVINNLDKYGRK